MAKLMSVLGIVLLAIGVALALIGFINPAQVQVHGLTMDTAAMMVVGGILSLGLGGVISTLSQSTVISPQHTEEPASSTPVVEEHAIETPPPAAEQPASEPVTTGRIRFPGFGRKSAESAAAATVVAPAADKGSTSVQETIEALEQAKTDIKKALGGSDNADAPAADATTGAEGDLYVLEDKVIRGRPARILSDGTVEAETDEGWMRFENLEHLDEYLDALTQEGS